MAKTRTLDDIKSDIADLRRAAQIDPDRADTYNRIAARYQATAAALQKVEVKTARR